MTRFNKAKELVLLKHYNLLGYGPIASDRSMVFIMAVLCYCRFSAVDQNENRRLDAMEALNIPRENIFIDKQSGKNTVRSGLQKLLVEVSRGDTVIVESVSRFARNTKDLLDLIDKLTTKGVEFVSQY